MFFGERLVEPTASERPSRWLGYLPPGTFRAEITDRQGTRYELFEVARTQKILRLRR